jgi:hypothetical protein
VNVDDDLVQRIGGALYRSFRGRVIATPDDQLAQDIAWEIPRLRAVGRETYIKKQEQTIARLREVGLLEAYPEEPWLAPALLEAAEKGLLREVADLVDGGDSSRYPGQYRVVQAYAEVHFRKKRPPLIGELLKELGIDKPKQTKANMPEWLKVNSRERVIRETLKRFDLPLSAGKRGRPRSRGRYSEPRLKK